MRFVCILLPLFILSLRPAIAQNADQFLDTCATLSSEAAIELALHELRSATRSDSSSFFALRNACGSSKLGPEVREALLVPLIVYEAQWNKHHDHIAEALLLLQKNWDRIRADRGAIHAEAALMMSDIFLSLGAPHSSIDYGLQALDAAKITTDSFLTVRCYNSIGEGYRHTDEYARALEYFNQGLEYAQNSLDLQPRMLNNSAIVLSKMGRFEEAKLRLEKGLIITSKTGDDYGTARLLTNLGFIHKEEGLYDPALGYYRRSLEVKRTIDDPASIAYTLNDIGEVLNLMGNHSAALRYSQEALVIAKQEKQPYYIRDMHLTLAYIFEETGQFDSAFYYFEQYQAFQDSIVNLDNARDLARIERIHDLKEKDQENKLLSAQNALHKAKINQQLYLLLLSMALILCLLVFGLLLLGANRRRKKLLEKVASQNQLLAEQNTRLSTALNEQESLFDIVAHDLRGPLQNIHGLITLEAQAPLDKSEYEATLQRIGSSANGALQFIRDFETLQSLEKKHERPKKAVFDLGTVISSAMEDFSSDIKDKKLDIHYSPSSVQVNSVESYVRHIFYNLLSNAIKYSPEGGSIFVHVIQKDSTRISIEDQGPGIAAEAQQRIFERFYRGRPSPYDSGSYSSGLGLALVRLLVDRLGGRIKLRSEQGKGAAFTVYLS